ERRQLLLAMALRRVQVGSGSRDTFLAERRTAVFDWPDLRHILAPVRWCIVGGVATRAYMPERATQDLDILVHERDHEQALVLLAEANYTDGGALSIPGRVLYSPADVEIDLLWSRDEWLDPALDNLAQDPAGYPVLALPYLVLMKLGASRVQDMADVSRMLGWADEEMLAEVRRVVARYNPADKDDLESLIFLGRQERGAGD
ncbi:MAG: hypothetical protein KDD89_09300, partial [Anaerolineales bacterium]|nr:hypothetical protein [Anaerolineales bacterium]